VISHALDLCAFDGNREPGSATDFRRSRRGPKSTGLNLAGAPSSSVPSCWPAGPVDEKGREIGHCIDPRSEPLERSNLKFEPAQLSVSVRVEPLAKAGCARRRMAMTKTMLAALAGLAFLLTGSLVSKANATPLSGVGTLPPLVHSYSPVENVRCVCGPRGCACGRAWRRGYWGWGPRWGWGGPYWRHRHWHHRRCWWRRGVRVCRW
jgi:hypothetical protein